MMDFNFIWNKPYKEDRENKQSKETNIVKVRPKASVEYSYGNDGKDEHYYIQYRCAGCNRVISQGDIACDNCGTFHDWSMKADYVIKREIIWR